MQYEELITFVTLAEVKNFTRTAEKLLMSQPSVSLHIKNLEAEFQTKLFHRSHKQLKITSSGQLLLKSAKQIIEIYEDTKKTILEMEGGMKGKLKIGSSFTIGENIVPQLLKDLQSYYEELEFDVKIGNTEEIIQLVRQLEVDIGLVEGNAKDKELRIVPFMEDELFIVASNDHPLAKKKEVDMKDLQNQVWVTREVGSGTRDYLHHIIRSNKLKVKSLFTINTNQGVKEAVMRGLGLSLLSRNVIRKGKEGELSIVRLRNQAFKRTFSYVYSPVMEKEKSVQTFLNFLHEKWN